MKVNFKIESSLGKFNLNSVITLEPNKMNLPINRIKSIKEMNEIIRILKESNYGDMVITKSGGISYQNKNLGRVYHISIYKQYNVEILVKDEDGYTRIQYRDGVKDENDIPGTKAYKELTDNGRLEGDIEEQPEKLDKWYQITLFNPMLKNLTIKNVHHIDLNSAFPYYLQQIHPRFKDKVLYHYNNRKKEPISKAVMNHGIGLMRFKMPNTWKKIMHLVKERLERECKNIDGDIIAFNTDGIWFTGKWNGKSSTELGRFKLDHQNCTIRFKSRGTYEYIEDGIYNPVQRGVPKEFNKVWGDIYNNNPKKIKLNKEGYLETTEVDEDLIW